MNDSKVVVDSSIFIASLLRLESARRRQIGTDTSHSYYCPRFFIVELFKHKERIAALSQLNEQELLEGHELLAHIQFVEEGSIPIGTWMEARRLCRDVDMKDAPFVALTLYLDGQLWTDDMELKTGLRAKGFTAFC
jgi:predicted nucleic acid-binding protein